ncbi:3-deoxy-7-phosphoheptulonate synthase [Capsulimonas corticalis]|uniref:3-deoxy-7-phosphoheptulonate synthase n=1 Tax=Capsulimonas corticalis TaxID=2219043 RepID=A0A402CV78_9BACT|nr:3-deoxy-7-phosphoheptulonate synthase [Capsulimonas corticalis]BDI30318.1 3-deoxy-7-phosphoheptulonate synthase [Capsulimonas corticalis]
MIIILSSQATKENLSHVTQMLEDRGYAVHLSEGVERTIVGAVGVPADATQKAAVMEQFEALAYVEKVVPVSKPYKVVNKAFHPEPTVIDVRGIKIGDPSSVVMMAGPCTVETEEQLMEAARAVKAAGATILRGGAFKPSTSPYSFHGHGEAALKMLAAAREELNMPIITEVMDVRDVEMVCQYADILQIGTRNMANFSLLNEIGKTQTPALLKRGMAATIEEWLQAAEYIANQGNKNIMLCERGIRTFETYTRNTFDINAIPALKELSHLPVIADPSHATGKASLVSAVSRAAVAAGADGLIIEVHPNPEKALKDGAQSLLPEAFVKLMQDLAPICTAVGRTL